MPESIGQRLKRLRLASKLSQAKVAKASGLCLKTLCRIERDENVPTIYSARAIAGVLGIGLEEFVGERELVQ
jgi:transcriptional regulator with XRE-family HTH domain